MESVLIAGSRSEAQAWQRRYPNRWSIVMAAPRATAGELRGLLVGSIDIAPGAVDLDHAALVREALDVMTMSGATCSDRTGMAEPTFLDATAEWAGERSG
jgi:hypothetical protein